MNPDKEKQYIQSKEHFIGYPCNVAYDYSDLYDSLKYNFNNVGDPFIPSLYQTHTKEEEQQVLQFFETLWHFDKNNAWGCTVDSGTAGNLQGLYIAREVFPGAMMYTSRDSHYSIFKIARILRIPLCIIETQENGEMNYQDFETKLLSNLDKPAIINANLGTTMKGAIDNPREIYRILCKNGKKKDYFMHADGALMGFVIPFLEQDIFFKKVLHSISISGHKFLGVPFPCGVFMTEKRFVDQINQNIEYIGCVDNTISGSRNGHAALFLNHIIKKKGYSGFATDVMECIHNSEFMIQEMQDRGMDAWRNNNSITVMFNRPSSDVVKKWQLASQGPWSHAVIMPHVTKAKIRSFVKDVRAHAHSKILLR